MKKPPQELVDAFLKWYANDIHSKNEDYYLNTVTQGYLAGLQRSDFTNFFYEFADEGGRVQSGGHRTSGQLRKMIETNYDQFRAFVLEPFNTDFDEAKWLDEARSFKHFGVGLATIYLNRVDKRRFPILNKKSADSLALFGVSLPTNRVKRYHLVRESQQQVIAWFPQFDNFFRADALNQFLVGEKEGARWKAELLGTQEPNPTDSEVHLNDTQTTALGNTEIRYWLYAPGQKAKFWDECWQKKIMVYGADELVDLQTYVSKDDIEKEITKARGLKHRPTNDARAAWEFSHVMKPGDVIIAKRGRQQYLGYGFVEGPYTYDASRVTYRNVRSVGWVTNGEWPEIKGPIVLKTLTDITKYPDYVGKLKKLLGIGEPPPKDPKPMATLNTILYGPPGTGKTFALWNEYRTRFAEGCCEYVTFHQSYCYEDFVEGIKPKMFEEVAEKLAYEVKPGVFKRMVRLALDDPGHNYALLIDEINRGNLASVFGELIALIEDDKRKGAANELRVQLPYSREEFVVPDNLYVIGAMNTADRSVEALDTALRRRFTFVAILPQPELIQQPSSLEVDLRSLLMTINARIEKLLDKDHCIGHSYFMDIAKNTDPIAELRRVFATRILPLLEEYFYGNPAKIGMVLGQHFVTRKDETIGFAPGDWGDEFEERRVYALQDVMTMEAEDFRTVYE